jgi:hypothetical protein
VLWVIAQDVVSHYGPLCRVRLCKKSEFPPQWATTGDVVLSYVFIAQDLVMRYRT